MSELHGANAPNLGAQRAPTPRRIPIELLPIISSYGGGASYPTTFVGDSEPSVGLSDPGAALRLAARVRGLDSAEFTLNGTGKGRRRGPRADQRQQIAQQNVLAREHTRIGEQRREEEDRDKIITALTPIGLM